jgi:hypothetical protein
LSAGESPEKRADCAHHAIVAFPEQCGENVLAKLITPHVIAAIAPWVVRCIEIHPMLLAATAYEVTPYAYALALQEQATAEAAEIDATCGIDIEHLFDTVHHFYCSQSRRCNSQEREY